VGFGRDVIRVLFGRQQFVEIALVGDADFKNPAGAERFLVDDFRLGA